jgi:acyl-CoA thioesterase YciA
MASDTFATERPEGDLTLQTVAFPKDTNSGGDVFGGWVISQMDIAAGTCAAQRAKGRCSTVAIEAMRFHAPIFVGDLVSVYTQIVKTGRTSLTMHVETWVRRQRTGFHLCRDLQFGREAGIAAAGLMGAGRGLSLVGQPKA